MHLRCAWQAWYLDTSTSTLRGRRGTYGIGLALVARLVLRCRRGRRGFLRGRNLYMTHPLLWPGAPYRRHREALRFAVDFERLQLPVRCRPLPRAGPASGRWHGCCSAGGSPRYAAGACPALWSLSRCAVAVSLHLLGEWLPADIGVGMSTPDALSACQPSWSCRRTWSPEQESVPLPDEQRLPSGAIGYVAGGCPAWLDFGGWRGSQPRQMLGGLQWRAAPTRPCDRQKKRSRSWQIRTVSVQSVAAVLVLPAFSGSYITALAAVAWQVQHAAMSSSLLVLLQLTVLMYLLSIGASEKKSLHDSRSFLLFCQVPTSSPSSSRPCRRSARGKNKRACGPIYIYICMQPYIHPSIHTYMHTYIHAYIHAYNTTCPYTTYSYLLFHTQLAPHQSFTISFPFPAFPMPSLPFFCCLLEVDMWGYPVL